MRSVIFAGLVSALALSAAGCSMMGGGDKSSASAGPANKGSSTSAAFIVAALADPARPQADKDRDDARKPGEMLAFANVKPGQKIGELIPGGGYFTRIFAKAVGPSGKVYAISNAGQLTRFKPIQDDKTNYPNVEVVTVDGAGFKAPEQLDMVWTSQNYHDLKNLPAPFDINLYNKAVLAALKPGGLYVIEDHMAKPDAAADVTKTQHRIQEDVVKKEVLAAGFTYVGETDALKNTTDPMTGPVFALHDKTSQFVMKFKKPG